MKNHRGELCECAQSNIFFVRDGVLRTPPVDAGLLVGVTRGFVLELAAKTGHPRREGDAARGRPRVRGRGVPHQHDARDRAGRPDRVATIGDGRRAR